MIVILKGLYNVSSRNVERRHVGVSLSYRITSAMMLVWTISVFFLGVLMRVRPTTAAGECEGVSTNVIDFLATFNGIYSNCKQRGNGAQEYDLLQAKLIPLQLPSLSQEPFWYVEQATNGWVEILILATVSEDENGILLMTPYSFTNGTRFRFGEYKLESLQSLKPGDIQKHETCKAVAQKVGDGSYLNNWPVCGRIIDGHTPTFSLQVKCERILIIMPAGGPIQPVLIPYNLEHYGDRYPVPGAPYDYVSPCWRK